MVTCLCVDRYCASHRRRPADVSSASVLQSQLSGQVLRAAPAEAAANAAAMASPHKLPSHNPVSAHSPPAALASHAAIDVGYIPTFSSAAASAAARQSVDYQAAHEMADNHAVGPDGKRVMCDWL